MPEGLTTSLRAWRRKHDLTQAQLAEAIGVSRKTINTIENGVFIPSTLLALKLAQLFECHVEDIFHLGEQLRRTRLD